jgi:hypothetical protein
MCGSGSSESGSAATYGTHGGGRPVHLLTRPRRLPEASLRFFNDLNDAKIGKLVGIRHRGVTIRVSR